MNDYQFLKDFSVKFVTCQYNSIPCRVVDPCMGGRKLYAFRNKLQLIWRPGLSTPETKGSRSQYRGGGKEKYIPDTKPQTPCS